ncbi:MAG: carboxypeptidase regulatory-like domain-containing protein, partial [Candidatus Cloacimonetes bacterium]|nr:carboxypeptidase regulatory-like domain-containing protein [Candidatus Cloacimonadota bacterium]
GAIAMYASTINQSWTPPMQAEFHANMLLKNEVKNTIGGLYFSGSMFMIDLSGTSGFDEFEHWTIFGDPSLQVRTDTPGSMTVNHNSVIPLGSSTYDVEVPGVEDALVSLFMDDTIYGYGYTDANGDVTIDLIEPLNDPGTMIVTVTAFNKTSYITNIDAIVPVQVSFSPDEIDANTETDVTVTVMDSDGTNPEVGVNVWADGLGYTTDPVVTDSNGEAVLTVEYPFGPELSIKGQRPDDDYQLFDEALAVAATPLTDPDLNVTTNFGMVDTFGMNLPGTIHKYVGEDDTKIWAKLNDGDFIDTTEDTLQMTPDETGAVTAIITKSGYDAHEELFPVKVAYGTVSGVVTDADNGAPVSNATVRFYNQGGDPSGDPLFSATTNSSGEYSVSDEYPVDYYDIYIDKWGFSPYEEMDYFLGYAENTHDIQIEAVESGYVTGQLVDNFSILSQGTLVYYRTDNGEQYASVDISDNAYSVSLPYFTYDIYVSSPGHVPYSGTITIDGDREVNYHLGHAALYSDFEPDDGDFVSNDPNGWQWGDPTGSGINAYSGVNVWATVLDGNYSNYADWQLESTSFTVPNSGTFTFYHYYDFEGGYTLYDGGNVKISTDGGSTYEVITPNSGYDGSITGLGNEQGFGGSNDAWEQVEFDLSDYSGETVKIMWHFGSDSYVDSYKGWYIDNVLVGNPDASYQIDVFEAGQEPEVKKLNLGQNYPNPVHGSTTISFALPQSTKDAELRIYNVLGQLVNKYSPDSKSGGKFDYTWNGTDMNGNDVANGIYFYRLSTEEKSLTKKMILVK